jgi:hypothetical protein
LVKTLREILKSVLEGRSQARPNINFPFICNLGLARKRTHCTFVSLRRPTFEGNQENH